MATPKFITIDNFVGDYSIDDDWYNEDTAASMEEQILRDLLGNTLYKEFIADLDGNHEPQTQKWIDFKDGKEYTDEILLNYEGIVNMIVAFSYYALIEFNTNSNSTGFTKNENQNSKVMNWYESQILGIERYNIGVNYYYNAFRFLDYYSDDFPGWVYKQKSFKKLINY